MYCFVLYPGTATLSGIWQKNVANYGTNLNKDYHPRTQQTKEGQQKNHNNAAEIHLESYFKVKLTKGLVPA
jgi:hypothetical protein